LKPITKRTAVLCSAVAVAIALAAPGAAQALTCGQTVNKDIKLQQNLDCSSSSTHGLIVGKPGITIDLNNKTLLGGGGGDSYYGIQNDTGKDRVKIINGTLKNWYRGVNLNLAARTTVRDVTIRTDSNNSFDGIYANYSTGGRFIDNRIFNAANAIYLYYGGGDRVIDNVFDHPGYGLNMNYSEGSTITGNVSKGDGGDTSNGFYVYYAADTIMRRNTANNGGSYGFFLSSSPGMIVDRARANNNAGYGIFLSDNDRQYNKQIRLTNSTANGNDYGIYSSYSAGAPGKGNKAVNNEFQDCYQVRCNG
jgi:nitrous oxidase accessory protein NosD